MPLGLCANTLRVLGQTPVPLSEIPRLTGTSPENSDIGWQAKPFVAIEPDPAARRGKVARLTPLGLKVQQKYHRLVREIEARWKARFGGENIRGFRDCLKSLFAARSVKGRPLLGEGMVPAEGTVRAGEQAPALGRRDVGSAARQRMRESRCPNRDVRSRPSECAAALSDVGYEPGIRAVRLSKFHRRCLSLCSKISPFSFPQLSGWLPQHQFATSARLTCWASFTLSLSSGFRFLIS